MSGLSRTSTSGNHRLQRGGVYWITGATGGIGRALAEHLARTYGARLILTARTEIAPDTIATLETAGGSVLARAADVTDAATMRAVADAAIERFGRIDGIIHAAGIAGGGVIALASPGAVSKVLAPKVDGTLVLAEIARERSVRFLALCSSLASVQGGFGQSDYVAANAFLDAFAARHTHDSGIFTVSIGWDAWRETGMALAVAAALHARAGTTTVAPTRLPSGLLTRDAIAIFERVLAGEASHVAVSTTDLDTRIASLLDGAKTVTRIAGGGTSHPAPRTSHLAEGISVDTDLAAVWSGVLGEDAGAHDNFFDVGGDSLKGVQLVARVNERFGLEIPVARFFGAPTLASLAALIRESAPQTAVPAGADPALDPSRERGRLRHERRRGRMPS